MGRPPQESNRVQKEKKISTESDHLIPPQRFIPDAILLAETWFRKLFTYVTNLRPQFARRTCGILPLSKVLPLAE